MEKEEIKIVTREHYIKKYSKKQKKFINKLIAISCFIYNQCLAYIKEVGYVDKNEIRKKFIHDNACSKWMLDNSDYEFRDQAFLKLKNNIKLLKERLKVDEKYKKTNTFLLAIKLLKFKSKYSIKHSLTVLAKHSNPKTKRAFRYKLFSTKELPKKIEQSVSFTRTNDFKYKMNESINYKAKNKNVENRNEALFIDPGSKIILTGYDPEGRAVIIGENDNKKLNRLSYYKSKLQSKIKSVKKKNKKYKMRKALIRAGNRIKNLVKDLHLKVSKFLCKSYKNIYIPKLNYHKLKKLDSQFKRELINLKLCAFVDILQYQSKKYNTNIFIVKEEYTTKTCTICGDFGSCDKRIFKCKNCKILINRDVNASRNIMIKYFTERPGIDTIVSTSGLGPAPIREVNNGFLIASTITE